MRIETTPWQPPAKGGRRRCRQPRLRPRHLALAMLPCVVTVHTLLWYDFGVPWRKASTFDGFAQLRYICMERPFARPDTLTLDGKLPTRRAGEQPELLPPWDGLNVFGGEYVHGEEAQPEYVAKLRGGSVDGRTGDVFDAHRIYAVDMCHDDEFTVDVDEPEWPTVSYHQRLATVAGMHEMHYFHFFAENLPRLLLLEQYLLTQAHDWLTCLHVGALLA
eukprot:SAG25_NODE_2643_length_1472_cov_36.564609_2_plen_219_part_00